MNSFDRKDYDVFNVAIFHSKLTIHDMLFTITSISSYLYSNKRNYVELETKLYNKLFFEV